MTLRKPESQIPSLRDARHRLLVAVVSWLLVASIAKADGSRDLLFLPQVLESVRTLYPPYLVVLIEQDIANGRTRQAMGAFDLTLSNDAYLNPAGYYNGSTNETLFNQPLPFMGGSVYGGYRLSSGILPDYNKDRTGEHGQAILGFRIPLLKDVRIDERRADLWKARIDQELADPVILRQYLDFVRAAQIAYYNWFAAGLQLALVEEVLQVAKDRDSALAIQIEKGASAPIVRVDNRRLVVIREIAVIQALRRFQATSIELSLFYRNRETAEPIVTTRFQVPGAFPKLTDPDESVVAADLAKAMIARPEVRRLDLLVEKNDIDLQLARNGLLPKLDIGAEAYQSLDSKRPKDIDQTEVDAMIRFSVPLQRREAKGKVEAVQGKADQLTRERQFACDRIAADVRDSFSALVAAYDGVQQSVVNVDLARQLEQAELERLEQGVTDLLALQIREKASYDARLLEVEARAAYFRARANYEAATAAKAPDSFPAAQ